MEASIRNRSSAGPGAAAASKEMESESAVLDESEQAAIIEKLRLQAASSDKIWSFMIPVASIGVSVFNGMFPDLSGICFCETLTLPQGDCGLIHCPRARSLPTTMTNSLVE